MRATTTQVPKQRARKGRGRDEGTGIASHIARTVRAQTDGDRAPGGRTPHGLVQGEGWGRSGCALYSVTRSACSNAQA